MDNRIKELLISSKQVIEDVKDELDFIKRNSSCVLVFRCASEIMFYGMTKANMNQISDDIKNVIPMPSKNNIKVMNHGSAENELKHIPSIVNGQGKVYKGEILTYEEYLKLYLEIVENNYKLLVEKFG